MLGVARAQTTPALIPSGMANCFRSAKSFILTDDVRPVKYLLASKKRPVQPLNLVPMVLPERPTDVPEQRSVRDLGIDLRGLDVVVAEYMLDGCEVGAAHEHQRGRRHPRAVERAVLAYAEPPQCPAKEDVRPCVVRHGEEPASPGT